jgi:hypothetical protein
MAEHVFYQRGRNKGNERKAILQSATLLVGKSPTKQKRIKLKLLINLTADRKVAGVPDWIIAAVSYISANHDVVQPAVEFSGFDLTFSAPNLFGDKSVQAPKCQLKKFTLAEIGDAENPDIAMTFGVYAPFSEALWRYCGQMGGEETWVKYEQIETEGESDGEDANLNLSPDESESEDEEEEGEDEDEEEEGGDDQPPAA